MTENIKSSSLLRDVALGVSGEIADAVHGMKGYDETFAITEEGDMYYQVYGSEEHPLTPANIGRLWGMAEEYKGNLEILGAEKVKIEIGKAGVRVSILTTPEVGEASWESFETPYEDESLPNVAS